MSHDPTEAARRELVAEINARPQAREELAAVHGEVYDTAELLLAFQVEGFLAPYVKVKRRSDGVVGTMMFQHKERYFYACQPVLS